MGAAYQSQWHYNLADYENVGQNLCFYEYSYDNKDQTGTILNCFKTWMAEKANYNYNTNTCTGPMCGHYTQVLFEFMW